jgi:hypothetical protein
VNQRLPPTRSVSLEKSAKRRRKEVYESFRITIAGYGVNIISEKFIINNQQPTIY